MASSLMVSGMVLLVVAAGLVVSSSARQQQMEDQQVDTCLAVTFSSVMDCEDVSTQGAAPNSDCCDSLKDMKDKAAPCFCRFLRDSGKLMQAPDFCGIPLGVSDCPAILGLSEDSADAALFMGQNQAASVNATSPSDSQSTFSSSFPFGLSPEAATHKSEGVVVRILSLGTVVSSMGVAAWMLA